MPVVVIDVVFIAPQSTVVNTELNTPDDEEEKGEIKREYFEVTIPAELDEAVVDAPEFVNIEKKIYKFPADDIV